MIMHYLKFFVQPSQKQIIFSWNFTQLNATRFQVARPDISGVTEATIARKTTSQTEQ